MTAQKIVGVGTFGEAQGLRPNTQLNRWKLAMILKSGGMGDIVNYSAVTLWLAKNCPWLHVQLFAPRYLVPLMKDIHKDFSQWTLFANEDFMQHFEDGMSIVAPDILIHGKNISRQFLTCVGAHPIDVAFAYYAGAAPPPPDCLLPVLDYPRDRLRKEVRDIGPYVVISTGNVHEARRVTGKHINPIVSHIKSRGLTPVFLGKSDLLGDGNTTTTFPDDIDYAAGLDLRNQTTVKEAACILQHAACTVGLDTGLLHLAALMKDSRIVFGYNITSVAHREPRRNHGKHVNIYLTEDELKCIGCQSKIRMVQHQFDKCIYGDNLCIDLLFKDNAARWTAAIDEVLNG